MSSGLHLDPVSSDRADVVVLMSRDASARITGVPDDPASDRDEEEDETARLARFAMKLLRRAAKTKDASVNDFASTANLTSPECHWVNNTDVQNK